MDLIQRRRPPNRGETENEIGLESGLFADNSGLPSLGCEGGQNQRKFELRGLSPSFWDLVDHEFWRAPSYREIPLFHGMKSSCPSNSALVRISPLATWIT